MVADVAAAKKPQPSKAKAPRRARKPKAVVDREAKFLEAYLNDPERNATRAAIKAGYSKHSAASQASRLLRRANIAQVVAQADVKVAQHVEKVVEGFAITKEAIAQELASIAFAKIDPDTIKAADKIRAGVDLAKLYGFLTEKQEHAIPALDALLETVRGISRRSALPIGSQRVIEHDPSPQPKGPSA